MNSVLATFSAIAIYCTTVSGQEGQPPIVTTVCELAKTPEKFDSKFVRVRAEVVAGFEVSVIRDEACPGRIWLGGDSREDEHDSNRWLGQFAYGSGSQIEQLMPDTVLQWKPISRRPTVTLVQDHALEQLNHAASDIHLKDRNCMAHKVTATIVGRFDYDPPSRVVWVRSDPGAKPKAYGTGYGHLNAYRSRLVLQSVTEVTIGPTNSCWDEAEATAKSATSR